MTRSIGRFDPKPGVVCPGFWRLPYIAACPHGCAYCYLQGTYWRGRPRDLTEEDLPALLREVERWMERTGCPNCGSPVCTVDFFSQEKPDTQCDDCGHCYDIENARAILNAGELSDSFAPEISAELSLRLIEMFREQTRHTLLLVTKASPQELLSIDPTPQVIVSFSVAGSHGYPPCVDGRYTRIGPDWPRAGLVRELASRWRVRIRLDPLMGEWEAGLARMVFGLPGSTERITLGSLRFTATTYRAMCNGTEAQRALADRVCADPNGGSHPWRLPVEERIRIYSEIKSQFGAAGLCKETSEVYAALGLDPAHNQCNCMP